MGGFASVQTVDVGGRPVGFREVGQGEPIVLVHGWPLSSQTWRKVVPELASEWRCIALDLYGAGSTPAPDGVPLSIAAQGELIADFLDALGLDRVILVGHDSGGSVARSFAIASPERVSRLILADTEVPDHHPFLAPTVVRIASLPGSRRILGATLRSRRSRRLLFKIAFADSRRGNVDEFIEAAVAPNVDSDAALDGAHRFLQGFDFGDVDEARAHYTRLTMPKLVIWGTRDRFFPIAAGRSLAAMLPEPVRFEPVPDTGLLVHEEAPDAWVSNVRSFLGSTG